MKDRKTKLHVIKLDVKYYESVSNRIKTFEVRLNDRDYRVGDMLLMYEWTGTEYTGRTLTRRIKYILTLDEFGMKDWVVMAIK